MKEKQKIVLNLEQKRWYIFNAYISAYIFVVQSYIDGLQANRHGLNTTKLQFWFQAVFSWPKLSLIYAFLNVGRYIRVSLQQLQTNPKTSLHNTQWADINLTRSYFPKPKCQSKFDICHYYLYKLTLIYCTVLLHLSAILSVPEIDRY